VGVVSGPVIPDEESRFICHDRIVAISLKTFNFSAVKKKAAKNDGLDDKGLFALLFLFLYNLAGAKKELA
jgi:hypothetical protein